MSDRLPDAVGILMPAISNPEMFSIRYKGLERELGVLGTAAAFAFTHNSYDPLTHSFKDVKSSSFEPLYAVPYIKLARDLTMPATDDKPIYRDPDAPLLVHPLSFSNFLKDKSNLLAVLPEIHPKTVLATKGELIEASAAIMGKFVVVKPVIGKLSQNVYVGLKEKLDTESMPDGKYLVQEYIDTSKGVESLGISDVHNIRLLAIDSEVVGAVGRINQSGGIFLHGEHDVYSRVYLPEELPETMVAIAGKVHEHLKNLPGAGKSVIAIDVMRGYKADGEEIDVLCEVNRRPLRISEWNLRTPQIDPSGLLWLAQQWDKKEASMLAGMLNE
jgi:hypothetical protein